MNIAGRRVLALLWGAAMAQAAAPSVEARRYDDRGVAATEMAKSAEDYEPALRDLQFDLVCTQVSNSANPGFVGSRQRLVVDLRNKKWAWQATNPQPIRSVGADQITFEAGEGKVELAKGRFEIDRYSLEYDRVARRLTQIVTKTKPAQYGPSEQYVVTWNCENAPFSGWAARSAHIADFSSNAYGPWQSYSGQGSNVEVSLRMTTSASTGEVGAHEIIQGVATLIWLKAPQAVWRCLSPHRIAFDPTAPRT